MLMPPDAEPVMPASELTDTAALTSGFGMLFNASLTTMKPGSAAITPPNPYSDAVFNDASSAPATADLVPVAKRSLTRLKAVATTSRMPSSSAPSTAQIATTDLMVAVTGACTPGSTSGATVYDAPYQSGSIRVSAKFAMPTSTSGATASRGCGSCDVSTRSGSLTSDVPYPSPFAIAARRRHSRNVSPTTMMNSDPAMPSPGAAHAVVLKNVVGMMFWICGVPGKASIVKLNAPSAIGQGISRFGISP